MGSESVQEQVRSIIDRYSTGTEAHGLQIELISVDEGVARLRLDQQVTEHQCSECDIHIPVALNYLMHDLQNVKGVERVESE